MSRVAFIYVACNTSHSMTTAILSLRRNLQKLWNVAVEVRVECMFQDMSQLKDSFMKRASIKHYLLKKIKKKTGHVYEKKQKRPDNNIELKKSKRYWILFNESVFNEKKHHETEKSHTR